MTHKGRAPRDDEDWDEPTEITEDKPRYPWDPGFDLEVDDEPEEDDLLELGAEDLEPLDLEPLPDLDTLLHRARLRCPDGSECWHLGDARHFLGGEGGIPVAGSVFERAAEIRWTDDGHHLAQMGRRANLRVNGATVTEHTLEPGDEIRVARARFVYDLA